MSDANARMQSVVDRFLQGKTAPRILEAGCGSTSHLHFPADAEIFGIDISQAQLDRNLHLRKKFLGDLQTYDFEPQSVDMIVCWDVLEHLPRPELAMTNFLRAIRPGGLIVLAMPNLISIKGLVTKLTPFSVHTFFYKYVMKDRTAGTSEFRQFPTFLRAAIRPGAVCRFARNNGLAIDFLNIYEGPVQEELRRRSRLANLAFAAANLGCRAVTLGRGTLNHSDYMVALRAPETRHTPDAKQQRIEQEPQIAQAS